MSGRVSDSQARQFLRNSICFESRAGWGRRSALLAYLVLLAETHLLHSQFATLCILQCPYRQHGLIKNLLLTFDPCTVDRRWVKRVLQGRPESFRTVLRLGDRVTNLARPSTHSGMCRVLVETLSWCLRHLENRRALL